MAPTPEAATASAAATGVEAMSTTSRGWVVRRDRWYYLSDGDGTASSVRGARVFDDEVEAHEAAKSWALVHRNWRTRPVVLEVSWMPPKLVRAKRC